MSFVSNSAARFRFRRALEGSLAAGGSFDLALGILLSAAPDTVLGMLHIPGPMPRFYLQLVATLTALLGCHSVLAASDVRRYSGLIALVIVSRLLLALTLLLAAAEHPDLDALGVLAAVEFVFAGVHVAAWWSIRS